MEMIIAILLWLQAMCGGGRYTQVEYDMMVHRNEEVINQVLLDPALKNSVWEEERVIVPTVVIIDGQ